MREGGLFKHFNCVAWADVLSIQWEGPVRRELRRTYHQHLVKVLFKLVNVGVGLQALSFGDHAADHELVILFHEEAAFEHLLALAHQLQVKCNRLNRGETQREHVYRD